MALDPIMLTGDKARAFRAELLTRSKRLNAEAESLPLSSADRFKCRELARAYELTIERMDRVAVFDVVVPMPGVTPQTCAFGPWTPQTYDRDALTPDEEAAVFPARAQAAE